MLALRGSFAANAWTKRPLVGSAWRSLELNDCLRDARLSAAVSYTVGTAGTERADSCGWQGSR